MIRTFGLRFLLTDKAHVALTTLSNDVHSSYVSLKAALKEGFEPSSKREVYKVEFKVIGKEAWRAVAILEMNCYS